MSLLKNTVLASIGLFEVTRVRAERIIDDLIKRGELNRSDRKQAVLELLDKADKSSADFRKKVVAEVEQVQKTVSQLTQELNWARQSDLKNLEKKVDQLAKAVKVPPTKNQKLDRAHRSRKRKKKE